MNYPVKIVGVVVDIHNLTMYKDDGETIVIPQGDPRLKDLVAKLVPAIETSNEYLLVAEDMANRNHFAEAEKKSNGVIRFFRMAKAKVQELVEKFVEPISSIEVGTKGKTPTPHVHTVTGADGEVVFIKEGPKPVFPKPEERPLTRSEAAVAQIMEQAVPSSSPRFNSPDEVGEDATTVVAVMADNTIIPGVEVLSLQAQSLGEQGKGTGMENFLRRAAMIKRGHSVEDLLKFVEKGELPLADDGCVLVYKLLNTTSVSGVFVDVHSGNVKQRVGSYVHMDETMVDANRSRDCSNGLHVARRDYLGSFSGNVCVLAKLAPEDVIAVPEYDARKLRAKGYHIIAKLTEEDRRLVCSNKPMKDQILLGNAIAGNHIGVTEFVKITKQKGGGLIVTPASEVVQEMPELDQSLTGSSLDHLPADGNSEACKIDARALALDLATGKDETVQTTVEDGRVVGVSPAMTALYGILDEAQSRYQPEPLGEGPDGADEAYFRRPTKVTPGGQLAVAFTAIPNLTNAIALVDFKKSKKKGWAALGIDAAVGEQALKVVAAGKAIEAVAVTLPKAKPDNDDKQLQDMTKKAQVKPKPKPPVKTTAAKTKTPIKNGVITPLPDKPVKASKTGVASVKVPAIPKTAAKPKAKAPAKAPTPEITAAKTKVAAIVKGQKMTQQEEMAKLVEIYNRNPDKPNARAIYAFKQKAKKGWDVLGVTDTKFIKKITERAKL